MLGSNDTATVKRLAVAGGFSTYSNTIISARECYIERVSLSQAVLIDAGNPFEVYEMIVDGTDTILINDQVTDQDSREYRVVSVQPVSDFVKFNKVLMKGVTQ